MAKYEVLTAFVDVKTSKHVEIGDVVEFSDERFSEFADNAEFYGGVECFLRLFEEVTEEVTEKTTKKTKNKK